MNEDLYHAVVDYTNWYTGRFGTAKEEFRQANRFQATLRAHKPSLKTAWRNARNRANVEGRFHDARHTFVTDLAESGAGDEVIRDMAGHVSKEMLKHYSHIRTQAKRQTVEALVTKLVLGSPHTETAAGDPDTITQNSRTVPQGGWILGDFSRFIESAGFGCLRLSPEFR